MVFEANFWQLRKICGKIIRQMQCVLSLAYQLQFTIGSEFKIRLKIPGGGRVGRKGEDIQKHIQCFYSILDPAGVARK